MRAACAEAPADAVPELEAAACFEACGCCRSSIFWSNFSLSLLAEEKSMSLALASGTLLTYVGKIHEHFTSVQASLLWIRGYL